MLPISQSAIPADVLKKTVLRGKYHRVAWRVAIGSPHWTSSVRLFPSSFVVTVVTSIFRAVSARSMSTIARLGPPWLSETDGMTCKTFMRSVIPGARNLTIASSSGLCGVSVRQIRGRGHDRANSRIDFLRRNATDAAHVVNDAVAFPHGMPPFGLVEIPEHADTGHAGGRGKMQRPAVVPDKKQRLPQGSGVLAGRKPTA